ncbi:hypothetical protein A6A08_11160 [Nocardiopsis sp. TSRI0078]|uniref:DUF5719 family protein n=1 Tax=unclassified Nocardiopsis TaxID=2649073 RepID=UPI00093C2DD2|nr:DUF5719 family protein [Nocardiopsis sp. TSRI0078]OKI15081.1 hypothetical protein A6A08_11160 [Nocardiopsis sp. TSRI0078]
MRLIVENRFALFGLVALALAALFGIAFAVSPVTAELGVTEPGTVRPDHAVRVCPAPHEEGESSVTAFAPRVSRDDEGGLRAEQVPAAPENEGGDEDAGPEDADGEAGTGEAAGAGQGRSVGEEMTEPGHVWSADTGGAAAPTAVRAEGALASGLDAAQTTLSDGSVTEVRCAAPSIGTWFALPGGDDTEGMRIASLTAHLANPEGSRATVSVDVYTEGGPSYSAESRGISLPAGQSTELDLTELIQSTSAIGVHVRTSTGRVAASLLAEHASGPADWVPPTAAPAREHVVPGVPGGGGRRRLLVAVPGDEPVEVRVHAVASAPEEGEEAPEGDGDPGSAGDPVVLNVPPAASAWLTLESVLGGEPGTVVLESDAPVVAGVAAEAVAGEGEDVEVVETAYTSAVPPLGFPLDTTAVLPDVPAGAGTELVLGAVGGDAMLMATPIGADGTQGDAVRLEVAAGGTAVFGAGDDGWTAPAGTDPEDGYTVRLELLEGSAPVHAARVLRDGDGLSVLPVRPAPVRTALPAVRDSMVGIVP